MKEVVTAPESAVRMALALGILPCKGEVGFDDVNVKTADGPTPAGESEIVEAKPAVIPKERMREIIYVDLSKAANRSLADEVAGDGRGGWTDQGPEMDMRKLPTGDQVIGGVPFRIARGPKAVVAVQANPKPGGDVVKEATIPVGRKMEALYVLHAGAFLSGERKMCFEIIVKYKDGATAVVPVLAVPRQRRGLAGRARTRLRRVPGQPLHHRRPDREGRAEGQRHDLSQRANPRPRQARRARRVDHDSRRPQRPGPDPGLDRRYAVVTPRRGGPGL